MKNYSELHKEEFDPCSKDVGIIIGRFQSDYLHEGYKYLLDKVIKNHNMVIIMIGVAAPIFTKNNPLDYNARNVMIQQYLSSKYLQDKYIVTIPISDCESNEMWSENIDILVNTIAPTKSKLLYGGRDSFISSYSGNIDTYEISPIASHCSSDRRKELKSIVYSDPKFRAGIISATQNMFVASFQCIDVVIHDSDKKRIMLGRKKDQSLWRFIGGFVDVKDDSLEETVAREVSEELSINFSIGGIKYLMSTRVPDWRYKYEQEKIMSAVFTAQYVYGNAKASDDIVECKWFDLKALKENYKDVIVKEHRKIFKKFIK